MTYLLQFSVNVMKIPKSSSVHFATRVRRSRVIVRVDLNVSLCGQQHPKCERAIPLFCKLHSSSNHTNKNVTGISLHTRVTMHGNSNIKNSIHSKIGLKYKEEINEIRHLQHIFVRWRWNPRRFEKQTANNFKVLKCIAEDGWRILCLIFRAS
jgi:hypothetical protein